MKDADVFEIESNGEIYPSDKVYLPWKVWHSTLEMDSKYIINSSANKEAFLSGKGLMIN